MRSLLPPPSWTRLSRVMTFDTREDAAGAVYDAYFDASYIGWRELVQMYLDRDPAEDGPCETELLVVTMPNGYVVYQQLGGWLGAHVVTIRWRADWERRYLTNEARHAA